ncbi:RNA polymerase sigma factor [Actinoplanes sp. NPDC051513]|uniref:RNA polymerase sigma factor n=1 Tax=Actinoplanes sp. NPDC051513 TaxID=3363908 RepID=UPI0037A085E0
MNVLPILVDQAGHGDEDAWTELVRRYHPMLRSIARGMRLTPEEGADAAQTTWLELTRSLNRIRDPDRLGSWLATTMRHESLRLLSRRRREHLTDDWSGIPERSGGSLDAEIVRMERDRLLWQAVDDLPAHQRRLIRLLSRAAKPSYREIARTMAMPVGSIGPTRARALLRLRDLLAERGISADSFDLTA